MWNQFTRRNKETCCNWQVRRLRDGCEHIVGQASDQTLQKFIKVWHHRDIFCGRFVNTHWYFAIFPTHLGLSWLRKPFETKETNYKLPCQRLKTHAIELSTDWPQETSCSASGDFVLPFAFCLGWKHFFPKMPSPATDYLFVRFKTWKFSHLASRMQ